MFLYSPIAPDTSSPYSSFPPSLLPSFTMGIPQFRRRLDPYAVRAAIEPCNAVLDGPSLAYHILNICSIRTKRTSPFEQPSYGLLGRTAVAWLDRIQECGLTMYSQTFQATPAPS